MGKRNPNAKLPPTDVREMEYYVATEKKARRLGPFPTSMHALAAANSTGIKEWWWVDGTHKVKTP